MKVLRSYKYVFMYRDRWGGTLRGMFVMGLDRHKDGSEHYTVIKVSEGQVLQSTGALRPLPLSRLVWPSSVESTEEVHCCILPSNTTF